MVTPFPVPASPTTYSEPFFGQVYFAIQGDMMELAFCAGLRKNKDPDQPGWVARLTSAWKASYITIGHGDQWRDPSHWWPLPDELQPGLQVKLVVDRINGVSDELHAHEGDHIPATLATESRFLSVEARLGAMETSTALPVDVSSFVTDSTLAAALEAIEGRLSAVEARSKSRG